jgi:hypothetical protein
MSKVGRVLKYGWMVAGQSGSLGGLLYCQPALLLYRKGDAGSGLIGIPSASAQPGQTSSLRVLILRSGGGISNNLSLSYVC